MTRIFHVSDVHFGLEDRQAIDWFRECVAQETPDAVALTGDLTMRARRREYQAASDWILSLDAPVTVEVGNHDLPYFNPVERFLAPYRRFSRIEGLIERKIDLGRTSLVSLKTTARAQWRLNWSKGHVSARALDDTLRQIAALPPRQTVLVCCHHPLVEAGTRGNALTTNGDRALAALAKAGVAAVLSGHVHDSFDLIKPTPEGPVRMIGAGTLSQRVRSTPPSFNELRIEDGAIKVLNRNLEQATTREMQIEDVPPNAEPPVGGEAVAPIAAKRADPI